MIPEKGKSFERRLGKKKPRDSEDRVQKKLARLGVKKQPGSGAILGRKSDHEMAAPESYHFEDKTTFNTKEARLKIGWLSKINRESRARRKVPVLVMGFEQLARPVPQDWAMLPLEELVKLIEAAGGRPTDRDD